MSQQDTTQPVTVGDLCLLAETFMEGAQYEKAVQIYELACKLFPENLALKINLGRARNLKSQSFSSPRDILGTNGTPKNGTDGVLLGNKYQGLGETFLKNGRKEDALRVFEMSKVGNPNFYLPYMHLGRLHLESGNLPKAVKELERARKLNPFNEEIADLLSAAYLQSREFEDALKNAVDAFILSGEISKATGPYRSKIKRILEKMPAFNSTMRNALIQDRKRRIETLYQEIESEIKTVSEPGTPVDSSSPNPRTMAPSDREDQKRAYDMALLLKRHLIFRNMEDESVLKVAKFTSEVHVPKGSLVYQEQDPVYGLYLINEGQLQIQKKTPHGEIEFATLEKGSFFGDDNLLSGRERYTSAVALRDSEVLFIDKAGLATIFARERAIAIHFLWYFWKSLSFQIRQSNEQMTNFFASTPEQKKREILAATGKTGGAPVNIELDKKLEVLQAKGLNTKELHLLARFSNEEIYNQGEYVFREGDLGDRLYIVLRGKVLISKEIAGTGEEALAVLESGDFFGEMALIGNDHHRSADAKAQEQGTTVLVITNQVLREILSIDTDSAYQFLSILCRILSQRLQEMHEKVYQWRLISGEFQ